MIIRHVEPSNVWSFYTMNADRLQRETAVIAENTDTGYLVCLENDYSYPLLFVSKEGSERREDEDYALSGDECEEIATEFYSKYLYPVEEFEEEPDDDSTELTEEELSDLIYNREDALLMATADYIATLASITDTSEILEKLGDEKLFDILDDVCVLVSKGGLVDVYRPTITDEEDGSFCYIEYPYMS